MPKPKQFLKETKKKSKHAPSVPTTADEYLAAGVDFEEAGEKWRGGDAAKSTRFFVRAIDCYEEALKKFPHSFDLAYNKARLQYELTQHPKLLQQLPGSLLELLQTAIESSRYALKLNEQNADVLFNTSQALTSYVEALQDASSTIDPLPFLQEALELFQKCLEYQELQHREFEEQTAALEAQAAQEMDTSDGGVSLNTGSTMDVDSEPATPSTNRDLPLNTPSSPSEVEDERWATIVEPVTASSLLDTLIAQLRTLTILCTQLPIPSGQALHFITSYASGIFPTKLDTYCASTGRQIEAIIARDDYLSSLSDLQFRNGLLSAKDYHNTINGLYTFPPPQPAQTAEALVKKAESLTTFHASISSPQSSDQNPDNAHLSWSALSQALNLLTQASKLRDVENLAQIHILRGDCEMLRYQMSSYPEAQKHREVLLKNAETFYRGGKNTAKVEGEKEVENEGMLREAVVKGLRGDIVGMQSILKDLGTAVSRNWLEKELSAMVEDGVVTGDQITGLGILG